MWGCSVPPLSMGWWGGFIPGLIGLLIIIGVAGFILYCIGQRTKPRCSSLASNRDNIDSLAILKARYARGEITLEEFNAMKQVLSKS